MNQHYKSIRFSAALFFVTLFSLGTLHAQLNLEGEFRARWYSDTYIGKLDQQGKENYMRYDGSIRAKTQIGANALFSTELIAISNNPQLPTRDFAGTGEFTYGIAEMFGEVTQPDFLVFDLARLRVGRQQFPIGNGLSFGESYNPTRFDGGRIDLARGIFSLSLFGAITGQNLSTSGLYPDPGTDQVYVSRLGVNIFQQDVMGYYIFHKLRGDYNDSYIVGGGSSGTAFIDKLEYFVEAAYQKFDVAPGLPLKHGIGYMAGASYQWTMGPFKSVKFESRYAAFQGDDASTPDQEQFSPLYTSFFWGARAGYADGDVGGDYPHAGQNLEGSRIWYSRLYVIPRNLPKVRVQVQYTKVNEFVNNDGINSMDDEFAARVYYTFATQVQLQFRYSMTLPNAGNYDFNHDGTISLSENRYKVETYMLEMVLHF